MTLDKETRILLRNYYIIRGHNVSLGLTEELFPRIVSPITLSGADDLIISSWLDAALKEELDYLRLGIKHLMFDIEATQREGGNDISGRVKDLQEMVSSSQLLARSLEMYDCQWH